MSILRSVNWLNQQRVDVPHLRSVESAVRNDFDNLMNALVLGIDKTYIVRGLEISMSGAIGSSANSLQLIVANSSFLHGTSDVAGTLFTVPTGTPNEILSPVTNSKVDGSFTPNSLNFLGLEFVRDIDDSTIGQVFIWNPGIKTEVTKTAPLAVTLSYKLVITTSNFDPNILPIAVVETDSANNVLRIEDRRPLLLRLGTAGSTTPDPFYSYPWTNQSEGREENNYSSSSSAVSPFRGGDKQILSLKEWMDAIMSNIKEIKGTTFWYSESSGGSLLKLKSDLGNTIITGRAAISHNGLVAGRINWNRNIYLTVLGTKLRYTILSNESSSDLTLNDREVAYIKLVRGVDVSPNLIFTNGSAIVTSVGAASWTTSMQAGDFIKVGSSGDDKYYEILTVDSASQVTLVENYAESSTGSSGVKSKYAWATYETNAVPSTDRHIKIVDIQDVPDDEDTFWLFTREDNGDVGQEQADITTVADVAGSLDGTYFLLDGPDTYRLYYVWYNVFSSSDPMISGRNGIEVQLTTGDSADEVAIKTAEKINQYREFSATVASNVISLTMEQQGEVADLEDVDTGFTFNVTVQGGKPKVYARVTGSEIEQGETRQTSDNQNFQIVNYTGMKSESDSTPNYSTSVDNLIAEVVTITLDTGAAIASGSYFYINAVNDTERYYVWFNVDGAGTDPTPLNRIGIEVPISSVNSAIQVAAALYTELNAIADFNPVDNLDGTVTVTWPQAGDVTHASDVNVGGLFDITVNVNGFGEFNHYLYDNESLTKALKRLDVAINENLQGFEHEAYEEKISIVVGAPANDNELTGTVLANTDIEIPLDSRDNNVKKGYIVGDGELEVFLNGQYLFVGDDWTEVGVLGTESTTIQITQDLIVGDVLILRLDNGTIGSNGENVAGAAEVGAYDEQLAVVAGPPANDNEVTGTVTAGTNVTIPLDSRDGDAIRSYIVGEGQLEVYLNGQVLSNGVDWLEIGISGSNSNEVEFTQDLIVGDVVIFRIDQSSANGGSGGPNPLGEANTGSNVGSGAGVFKTKTGVDLQFRRLQAGANVTISQGIDEVIISATPGTALNNTVIITGTDTALTNANDVIGVVNSGVDVTLTLPSAVGLDGKEFKIKKLDAGNTLYIESVLSQTLDGVNITSSPHAITVQWESISIIAISNNWYVF